jgi:hypothetical protein
MSMTNLPDLPHPEYREAVRAYGKFQADLAESQAEVARLRGTREVRDAQGVSRWIGGELERARAADDEAQASALVAGEGPPARTYEAEVAKAIDAVVDRIGVLTRAVAQAETTVTDLLENRADELVMAATQAVDAEREAYEEAIAGLEAGRARFWATKQLVTWLSGTPSRSRYKTGLPAMEFGGLIQPNGEPARLEPVLEALRQEADPPVPERQPTTMRWKREVVYGDRPHGKGSAIIEERYTPIPVYADESEQVG